MEARRHDISGEVFIEDISHDVSDAHRHEGTSGPPDEAVFAAFSLPLEPHVPIPGQSAFGLRTLQNQIVKVTSWARGRAWIDSKISTYRWDASPLFGYFWLSWKEAHGAYMLLADLVLLACALILILRRARYGVHPYNTAQLVDWIGRPIRTQLVMPLATWGFGYVGPRAATHAAHFAVALIRAIACLVCLVRIFFRSDLGSLHRRALELVSVLVLAALAHLMGASIRTAHFERERTKALRNSADRRTHGGNGFKISYMSVEEREAQKAAARIHVGQPTSYLETLGAYWHHPTPQLDVLQDVDAEYRQRSWWDTVWTSTTPLQQHVKSIVDERPGPTTPPTAAVLRDELFAQCDCCVDSDDAPRTLMPRPTDLERLRRRRDILLDTLRTMDAQQGQHHSRPEAAVQHRLCEMCQSLCIESKLLRMLTGTITSQIWQRIKATFSYVGPLLEESFLIRDSATALRTSASNGCHLCCMIWNALSPQQQALLVREAESYNGTGSPSSHGVFVKILSPHGWQAEQSPNDESTQHLYIVAHYGLRSVPRFWMEQKFVLRARSLGKDPLLESPDLLPPIRICLTKLDDVSAFTQRSMSTSTRSESVMRYAASWLTAHRHFTDGEGHTLLQLPLSSATDRPTTHGPARPKRLLEIVSDERVRLVCETSPGPAEAYTALSYCWHSTNNYVLKKASLGYFMSSVASDGLPNTIRDALWVTRALGFRYIWIDALCIIQDCDDDKAVQLKDMHAIYAGATVVIAAAAAMDSSHNFLVDQTPHAMSVCLLDLDCEIPASTVQLPPNANGLVALPGQRTLLGAEIELSLSRLKSRGWVYQEEELASRVIYFCDRQLVLRCNTCNKVAVQQHLPQVPVRAVPNTIWGSTLPFGSVGAAALESWQRYYRAKSLYNPDLDTQRLLATELGSRFAIEGYSISTGGHTQLETQHERWWKLVGEYSSRHLTYGADKLPAIDGLADRFRLELAASQDWVAHPEPVRYQFGLWSGNALVMGLLWYVKEGGMARPMSRAPSWSWAAVDGLISNDSLKGNTQFDTCGSAVLQTAELGAEKLMIKARVKPGTWHRAPSDRKLYYLGHRRSGTVRFQHDLGQYEPLTSDLSQGPEVQTLRDLRGFEVGYLVLDSESELPYEGSEVYCLGIVVEPSTEIERRAFNVPWATRGLALVKVTGETNQYQRVGYLELQRTPGGVSYPSSINPAKQRAEREPAPNIDVAGFFDDCEFSTITLV